LTWIIFPDSYKTSDSVGSQCWAVVTFPQKKKHSVCGDQNAEVDEWTYKKQKQKD
jgi:hypothetical protein